MALIVDCACGERVQAEDDQAGQQVPCPACGQPVQLPEAYNPLSTARYMQQAAPDEAPPVPERSGPECDACAGSGQCRACGGQGRLPQAFLDRVTSAVGEAVSDAFKSLGAMLGGDSGPRKYKTRSEQRRGGGCPHCEATGKCFTCDGTGRAE